MLFVSVKEGEGIEKALKKLKKKIEKTGIIYELRKRQSFTKPSVKRRDIIKRAVYKQNFVLQEE